MTGRREAVIGQIAHIDQNRAKSREEDLAWLCLEHHTIYDSKSSQHKNYTPGELRYFKAMLEAAVERGDVGLDGPPPHHALIRFASIEVADGSSWFDMVETPGEDFTLFSAPWRGASGEGELPTDVCTDPILDVVLISEGDGCIVTRIGVQAIRAYSMLGGPPAPYRLSVSESLHLQMRWDLTTPQWVRLTDPWYLERKAPLRFTLRLADYANGLPGNRGVLRVAVNTDSGVLLSDGICLGI